MSDAFPVPVKSVNKNTCLSLCAVANIPPLSINRLDISRVHHLRQCRIERTQFAGYLVREVGVGQHVFGTAVVGNTGNQHQPFTSLHAYMGVLYTAKQTV